jgi:hypothetical protein
MDVGVKSYLLRVNLEILLQCSVFITVLIIVSVVSIKIVICCTKGLSVTFGVRCGTEK